MEAMLEKQEKERQPAELKKQERVLLSSIMTEASNCSLGDDSNQQMQRATTAC